MMKNYLKFIVAVFGITLATFGSVTSAYATKVKETTQCTGYGHCYIQDDGYQVIGGRNAE